MRAIRLPPVKETTFTSKGGKPYKKVWHLSNDFQIFSDVYSERTKNLLRGLEQCQRVAGWARLWTIEYQDFKGRANVTFRFALVRIRRSCGNTSDSASELRAIDKRFERTQGGAINKATTAQRYGKALPC
jgi:hypothetical protein